MYAADQPHIRGVGFPLSIVSKRYGGQQRGYNAICAYCVVAFGGNSLILDKNKPGVEYQWQAVYETARHIVDMIRDGWRVVITHGNGPQVGFILRRNELANKVEGIHLTPMDVIGADTQGSIGYMMQQALDNQLRVAGIRRGVVTVTQTLVTATIRPFRTPTSRLALLTEEEGKRFSDEGWTVVETLGAATAVWWPRPSPLRSSN